MMIFSKCCKNGSNHIYNSGKGWRLDGVISDESIADYNYPIIKFCPWCGWELSLPVDDKAFFVLSKAGNIY